MAMERLNATAFTSFNTFHRPTGMISRTSSTARVPAEHTCSLSKLLTGGGGGRFRGHLYVIGRGGGGELGGRENPGRNLIAGKGTPTVKCSPPHPGRVTTWYIFL